MSLLECRCRLRFPTGFALHIEFQTNARVTALVGPSGSGKTTTLAVIAGLRRPEAGVIKLKDRTLFDADRRLNLPPERRRLGYVFQDGLLFPHVRVRENLLYGQRRRGPTGIRLDQVVEVLEIGDLLERWPLSLSGGQRQRIALGRALLSGPELLLLDEPLASLDLELRGRVLGAVENILREFQVPALYVSHDPAEVRTIAQWVVEIQEGRVIRAGEPTTLSRVREEGNPIIGA
jgi:molybdate transport system ATP-binding protein